MKQFLQAVYIVFELRDWLRSYSVMDLGLQVQGLGLRVEDVGSGLVLRAWEVVSGIGGGGVVFRVLKFSGVLGYCV